MFDVTLFTGLPTTGEIVQFGDEVDISDLASLVRQQMTVYVEDKRGKLMRDIGSKKLKVFKHYINVMWILCEANKGQDQLGLWLQLLAWMVISGLFFLRTPCGATWGVQKYVQDVEGLALYNWVEAVWDIFLESLEETQQNLEREDMSDVQMNGFTPLIQVNVL